MPGVENVDRERFFSLSKDTRMQGHPMKLIGGRFRIDKRKNFTQCIVKLWKPLSQDVVMVTDLDGFKRGLDKFMVGKAINGY